VTTKFRHSVAVPVAGIIALVSALALGTASWWFAPVLLLPLAVILWGWLSGVDVDDRGVVVRSAVARRRLPWRDIEGFSGQDRRVVAHLRRGGVVALPGVRPVDVPRLIAAGGQELGSREPGDQEPGSREPGDQARGAHGPSRPEPGEGRAQ
jgi:hypothetical protein